MVNNGSTVVRETVSIPSSVYPNYHRQFIGSFDVGDNDTRLVLVRLGINGYNRGLTQEINNPRMSRRFVVSVIRSDPERKDLCSPFLPWLDNIAEEETWHLAHRS